MSKDTQSFDVLGQLGPMRRYALSLTRDAADAEDLVHDGLVRALERREQFRPGHNLRGWLLSILHNAFVDRLRARRSEAVRDAEIGRAAERLMPAPQEHSARLAEVREAFMALPDEQRAALHLVTLEGLSYDEAAKILGIPVGTVVSRISRARARLRSMEDGETETHGASSNVVQLKLAGGPDGTIA